MFEHIKDVLLPSGTVSPWLKNMAVTWLDTRNITYISVIEDRNVHVGQWDNKTETDITWSTISGNDINGDIRCMITAIELVHPNARNFPIIVIGTTFHIQIWDIRKTTAKVLFEITLETGLKELALDINRDIGTFCKGITCNDNTILVGTHSGEIIVLMCNGESHFSTRRNLKEHQFPVVDIVTCRYDEVTVSADTSGEIIVWQKTVKGTQSKISTNQPISVINVLRKHVIVGTMRGIIQYYSVVTGLLMSETNAHARVVTSISVAPESAYVMTASEDGTFIISKLHTRKPHAFQVEYRFSKTVPNIAIVGAQFTNGRGSAIAIAGYDQYYLSTYKIVKKTTASAT